VLNNVELNVVFFSIVIFIIQKLQRSAQMALQWNHQSFTLHQKVLSILFSVMNMAEVSWWNVVKTLYGAKRNWLV